MGTPTLVLIAVTTLAAGISLGGAIYQALVVDPYWPKRPGIIQAHNGGISWVRFWLPVHTLFEVLLVVTLVATWGDVDEAAALRWIRRSLLRLPLILVTCAAMLAALAVA